MMRQNFIPVLESCAAVLRSFFVKTETKKESIEMYLGLYHLKAGDIIEIPAPPEDMFEMWDSQWKTETFTIESVVEPGHYWVSKRG